MEKDTYRRIQEKYGERGTVWGFKTAAGSVYFVNGERTRRIKSYHPEHGPKDVGIKEYSERTVYVSADASDSCNDCMNSVKFWLIMLNDSDRQVTPLYFDEGSKTWVIYKSLNRMRHSRIERSFSFSNEPQVGLEPLELWEGKDNGEVVLYRGLHPGNTISEIYFKAGNAVRKIDSISSIAEEEQVVFGCPGYRHIGTPSSRDYWQKGGWKLHLTVKPENYEIVDK